MPDLFETSARFVIQQAYGFRTRKRWMPYRDRIHGAFPGEPETL
jgi:hypothetical protein